MRELGLSKHLHMLQAEELDIVTLKMMSEDEFKELVSTVVSV
jgi:hypothetical protein